MKYLKTIFFLLIGLPVFGQQGVTIAGEAYLPDGSPGSVTVLSPCKTAVNEWIYLANIPVNLNSTFNYKLELSKPQFLVIHYVGQVDLIVYAAPGDSIHINFQELTKPDVVQTLWATNNYMEKARLSGSDPARIAFFQLLKDKTGYLDGPPFSIPRDTANFYTVYKTKVTEVYKNRLKILDDEATVHHFSVDFKAIAVNEIEGEYITDLMFPTFDHDNLKNTPPGYFNEVNDYQPTWDKFKNSRSNHLMSFININYYNRPLRNQTREADFATIFNNCLRFKDDSVRNYLLTQTLSHSIDQRPGNFDEMLEKFQEVCTNQGYISDVLKLYKPASMGKPLPTEVLNSNMKTTTGQNTTLKDIIPNGKPVFIDFWASWCAPCRKEIPILMQLAEKYKNKVDFRFISIDASDKEADWLNAIKNASFKGLHYLIQDNVLTDFARIKSIPRYLVIDKDGKLTTYRGPNLLMDQNGFENTIKAVTGN